MKLTNNKITCILLSLFLLSTVFCSEALAVRIKDIASFSGMRNNQLVGYGLVVGLSGTGDTKDSTFTVTSMVNMMEKMGVSVDAKTLKPKNVAAVMVTAKMPLSAKSGTPLDIQISSIGNASSLLGGTLLQTPLKGIDGKVYALAQSSIALGGFTVEGAAARNQKNITTAAFVPGGAIVEREVPFDFNQQGDLTLNMSISDFTTTQSVVESLNQTMGGKYARAEDAQTVKIEIPQEYSGNLVPLLASIENIDVSPNGPAKVVVDEKTGTIVIGRDVRVAKVAISHGNLRVTVQEDQNVSQPGPFSMGGQTVVTPTTNVNAAEQENNLNMVEGATLQELVDGLNAIGATPRDLMSILKTLKSSGALYAELEII